MKIAVSEQPKILNDMLEGLGQAIGACSQLIHFLQDPRFILLRDFLDLAHEGITEQATLYAGSLTVKQ